MSQRNDGSAFTRPQRAILDPKDMASWEKSTAYTEIRSFIEQLSRSVEGKRISDEYAVSQPVKDICKLLDKVEQWIEVYPPDRTAPQRFGNKSFRSWEHELRQQAAPLLQDLLPPACHGAAIELVPYLSEAFGNATRIDYGSGHELSFMIWLLCLCKLGFLEPADSVAIVLVVFRKYLHVCQQLQRTYNLEPAGSRGIWGLDDYQFLPFYLGSAQLIGTQTTPAMSLDKGLISEAGDEYLYLQSIRFIMEVKRGPFFEHSRQLYDISGVPRWEKVNQGLGKMYKVEVLGKFPVVQHLVFGSLFSFAPEK
ncbi:Serine/threonine-protein phosphatase 2A activator [Dipsacomyces acuminosporus]|nr:Serine/threonine-protein phosphatase 2A activator [Dipsacomyces acuminosporus]